MPATVRKVGNQWCVFSHKGRGAKRLGCHPTIAKAKAQQRAVNRSLKQQGKIK